MLGLDPMGRHIRVADSYTSQPEAISASAVRPTPIIAVVWHAVCQLHTLWAAWVLPLQLRALRGVWQGMDKPLCTVGGRATPRGEGGSLLGQGKVPAASWHCSRQQQQACHRGRQSCPSQRGRFWQTNYPTKPEFSRHHLFLLSACMLGCVLQQRVIHLWPESVQPGLPGRHRILGGFSGSRTRLAKCEAGFGRLRLGRLLLLCLGIQLG